MKKMTFTIIATVLFTIINCSTPNKKETAIKESIKASAFGQDLGYKSVSTEEITKISYNDIFNVFLAVTGAENNSIDSLLIFTKNAQDIQKKEYNTEMYHYFGFLINRLNMVKNAEDKKAVVYSVYKHKYTIINPMFDNAKVPVTHYYFFDGNDKLICYLDETDFKEFVRGNIKHKYHPYEMMIYSETQN